MADPNPNVMGLFNPLGPDAMAFGKLLVTDQDAAASALAAAGIPPPTGSPMDSPFAPHSFGSPLPPPAPPPALGGFSPQQPKLTSGISPTRPGGYLPGQGEHLSPETPFNQRFQGQPAQGGFGAATGPTMPVRSVPTERVPGQRPEREDRPDGLGMDEEQRQERHNQRVERREARQEARDERKDQRDEKQKSWVDQLAAALSGVKMPTAGKPYIPQVRAPDVPAPRPIPTGNPIAQLLTALSGEKVAPNLLRLGQTMGR